MLRFHIMSRRLKIESGRRQHCCGSQFDVRSLAASHSAGLMTDTRRYCKGWTRVDFITCSRQATLSLANHDFSFEQASNSLQSIPWWLSQLSLDMLRFLLFRIRHDSFGNLTRNLFSECRVYGDGRRCLHVLMAFSRAFDSLKTAFITTSITSCFTSNSPSSQRLLRSSTLWRMHRSKAGT